jgi:hypothetical protein
MNPMAPDTPMNESIGVVFGATSGGPSAPFDLALPPISLGAMSQMVATYLSSPAGSFEPIHNIVAVTPDPNSTTSSLVTAFVGSTDRELVAPYFLVDTMGGGGSGTPWLLAMGHIGAASGGAGVAVVSSERDMSSSGTNIVHDASVWLLAAKDKTLSQVGSPLPIPQVGDPTMYANATGLGAWVSTLNLGGESGAAGDTILGLVFDPTLAGLSGKSLFVSLPPASTTPDMQTLNDTFVGPIVVSDIDGDGNPDVVIHSQSQVAVLWNGGMGSLSAPMMITVPAALRTAP